MMSAAGFGYVKAGGLTLHERPSVLAKVLDVLHNNEEIAVLSASKTRPGWLRVKVKRTSQEGWCNGRYIDVVQRSNSDWDVAAPQWEIPVEQPPEKIWNWIWPTAVIIIFVAAILFWRY
jgi:hypothetical protein